MRTRVTIVAITRLSIWGRLPLVFLAMATTACSGHGGATNSTDVGAFGTASGGTSNTGGRLDNGGAATSLGGGGGRGGAATGAGTANGFGGSATTTGGANQGGAVSSAGGAISSVGGAATTIGGAVNTGVKLGVYCGNDLAAVLQFETWLGRPVDGILGYTGAADWPDYDGSVGWAVGLWSSLDRPVFWSVPLIPKGATLDDAASGAYDDHYRKAAQKLAAHRPEDREVQIRTGWEFNGDWFPWAAQGKEQAFIGAFRHFVDAFRSVSTRFVFEWNVNIGNNSQTAMNPEAAYPGDAYVDIIGMDFYWNLIWDESDPLVAWQSMVKRPYGLEWHQTFAVDHKKRISYSEWGIMSNEAGRYIESAKAWFDVHGVVFQTYWNSDSDFKGKLSSGQYPSAGAAYRTAFGAR